LKRGDLFKVRKPDGDPKQSRVFVVVSRPALIASRFSAVICAPVYTSRHGLATEVNVGIDEGLKHESAVHCDALVSLSKAMLTDFAGSLSPSQLVKLDDALRIALHLE
jgi:mRNA interferase MazF